MDQLRTIFESIYNVNESYVVYMFTAVIFMIVAVIAFVGIRYFQRIKQIKSRAYTSSLAGGGDMELDSHMPRNEGLNKVATSFAKVAEKFAPEQQTSSASTIQDDMVQAGFHDRAALNWYYFARVACALGFPALGYPIMVATGLAQTTVLTIVLLIVLAAVGMITPSLYIMRRKNRFEAENRDGFPEVMDLLVVCTEAGVSLEAALSRVTEEIAKTHRHLGINLHIMNLELRAGRSLTEAFNSLAHRVTLDEVRSLGSLLKQSEELGTSLSEALRVYSQEMREKRFFRAEEKAYALPAKMVIPLGLFVFPVMLIMIMLPLLIRFSAAGMMGG